ncbi:hypothetical protein [Ensifer sp. Root127]|uniref:hypothetical protein n=1 Tax=Ensifer sp. Root127 TaxID=1736440 RepID=UPI0012E377EE|nr:hypothetical protein [Ensifer sp. Root127]
MNKGRPSREAAIELSARAIMALTETLVAISIEPNVIDRASTCTPLAYAKFSGQT